MAAQTDESKLTDRYQTTVPESVRKALHLHKRDRIRYIVRPNGSVLMQRAPAKEKDPLIGKFLSFLVKDMEKHPARIRALDAGLASRVQKLVRGVEIDLDAPLNPEDE
jgi:antitoxin PrlF